MIDGLEVSTSRAALEGAFALITEARRMAAVWRASWDLARWRIPDAWLARLKAPGIVLEPAEFLERRVAAGNLGLVEAAIPGRRGQIPAAGGALRVAGRFSGFADRDPADVFCPTGRSATTRPAPCGGFARASSRRATRFKRPLRQILRSRQAESGEDYVTLRNDRFVIPVRSEHRRNVPGVVHGARAKPGRQCSWSRFETVETNNQLVQLAEDEAAEIFRNA